MTIRPTKMLIITICGFGVIFISALALALEGLGVGGSANGVVAVLGFSLCVSLIVVCARICGTRLTVEPTDIVIRNNFADTALLGLTSIISLLFPPKTRCIEQWGSLRSRAAEFVPMR